MGLGRWGFVIYSFFSLVILMEGGLWARDTHGEWGTLETVRSFLSTQDTLRIFISDTPGLGSQTAAFDSMARARELGFKGKFEVLIDWPGRLATLRQRLGVVFPEGTQWLRPQHANSPIARHGDDLFFQFSAELALNNKVEMAWTLDHAGARNPRVFEILNAHQFLVLQPAHWFAPKGRWDRDTSGSPIFTDLPELQLLGPHPSQTRLLRSPKSAIVQELQKWRYWPIYSAFIDAVSIDRLMSSTEFLAPDKTPEIFVIVENSHRTVAEDLLPALKELRKNVRVIRKNYLARDLKAAKDQNQKAVVILDPLAHQDFDSLFAGSLYPPLIEGKSTEAFLLAKGKPFIFAGRDMSLVAFEAKFPDSEIVKRWRSVFSEMQGDTDGLRHAEAWIRDCLDRGSEVSQWFNARSNESVEEDLFYRSMTLAIAAAKSGSSRSTGVARVHEVFQRTRDRELNLDWKPHLKSHRLISQVSPSMESPNYEQHEGFDGTIQPIAAGTVFRIYGRNNNLDLTDRIPLEKAFNLSLKTPYAIKTYRDIFGITVLALDLPSLSLATDEDSRHDFVDFRLEKDLPAWRMHAAGGTSIDFLPLPLPGSNEYNLLQQHGGLPIRIIRYQKRGRLYGGCSLALSTLN